MNYYSFVDNELYLDIVRSFLKITILIAICITVFVISQITKQDDGPERAGTIAPWKLLVGTWRDSMLITIGYMAMDMMYRISDFSGLLATTNFNEPLSAVTFLMPFAYLTISIIILTICVLRFLKLKAWIYAQDFQD